MRKEQCPKTSTERMVRALPPNHRCLIRNCGRAEGRLSLQRREKGFSGDEWVGMASCWTREMFVRYLGG